MKVIDLLNKIANNEEVPKIFKFDGCTYILKREGVGCYRYEDIKDEKIFEERFILEELNDEIEIVEEKPKKIEHYDMFDYFTGYSFSGTDRDLLNHLQRNFENINHELDYLIRQVNYLLEKESDKQ